MKVVEQIRIARPREVVWDVLADFGNLSRWARNVDHSSLVTTQHRGVGAARRIQMGRVVLIERVVEWETGASLAYAVEGLPIVRGVVNGWTLETAGGTTKVSLTSRIDSNPVVGWVVGRVLSRDLRKLLDGLKSYVEENV
jgi:carbon monoxide dehydrogenase subunit G